MPRNVYNKAYNLLKKLQQLSENPAYAIPGGVVLLKQDGGHITPADVFNLLTNVLAEVEAIRVVVGDLSPLVMANRKTGKTPSNVYDKVSEALAIVETLL